MSAPMKQTLSASQLVALVDDAFQAAIAGDVAATIKLVGSKLADFDKGSAIGFGLFVYQRHSETLEWQYGQNALGRNSAFCLGDDKIPTELEEVVRFAVTQPKGWFWDSANLWLIPFSYHGALQGMIVASDASQVGMLRQATKVLAPALAVGKRVSELSAAARDYRAQATSGPIRSHQSNQPHKSQAKTQNVADSGLESQTIQPIWAGEAMGALKRQAKIIAQTALSVLIVGPTGSGKDILAQFIHKNGSLADQPMVVLNCAALSHNLIDSELFGHSKGAFTGAEQDRQGLIQQANGGTLFLDEVAELSLEAQAKLLRVLETGKLRPVGKSTEISVRFRLIAATHRSIPQMTEAGTFRQDLFFRLCQTRVTVPALSERGPKHFAALADVLVKGAKLSQKQIRWMWARQWPGNVRQLRSVLQTAAALNPALEVGAEHKSTTKAISDLSLKTALSPFEYFDQPVRTTRDDQKSVQQVVEIADDNVRGVEHEQGSTIAMAVGSSMSLKDVQNYAARTFLNWHLANSGGDRAAIAKTLSIPRRTLDHKIQTLGLGTRPTKHSFELGELS